MKLRICLLLSFCLFLSGCSHQSSLYQDLNRYGLYPSSSEEAPPSSSSGLESAVVPDQSARIPEPPPANILPNAPPRASEPASSEASSSSAAPSSSQSAPPSFAPPSSVSPPAAPPASSAAPSSSEEPKREPSPPPSSSSGDHSVGTQPDRNYQAQYEINAKLVLEEYYLPAIEDEILLLTNRHRESLGLSALQLSPELRQAARMRSREMYYYHYFDHLRPNGDAWHTVLDAVGLPLCHASENIAKGSYEGSPGQSDNLLSASFWQSEWENSPPHYGAIIDPDVTRIGVGFYYVVTEDAVSVYSTVLFAEL